MLEDRMMNNDAALWLHCNQRLIAKMIGECSYEECFSPTLFAEHKTGKGQYQLTFGTEHHYYFSAKKSIWGWLMVDAHSMTYNGSEPVSSAAQFLIHAQQALGLTDIVLANLLEETQNTLFSDLQQAKRFAHYRAPQLIAMNSAELQSLLDGHPKAIANKGRMGWGADELSQYTPESGQCIRPLLVAVRAERCQSGFLPDADPWTVVTDPLNSVQQATLANQFTQRGLTMSDYLPIPVHPWQWQHFIVPQYQAWIADGSIFMMDQLPDYYLPQQSIRTLTNMGPSGQQPTPRYDLKLPLTILNTSCYRGVPGEHITTGAKLSQWLLERTRQDNLLSEAGLIVQREVCGIHCNHPIQQQIDSAPYRYHEMLGAVWRESLEQLVSPGQNGILMATLMQCDIKGNALVTEYIQASGLTPEAWLTQLFTKVVVPLYHLMAKYGVGLVAHGQNVSVVLDQHIPVRAAIKDFHGDLRIIDLDFPELDDLPADVKRRLTRLPPHYLIHDLVTGHFITTLRFISPLLEAQCGVSETRFYQLLANTLRHYQQQHPELNDRFKLFPLFEESVLKVCINRVRFRLGYQDNAERPIPELGTPLPNPLAFLPRKTNAYNPLDMENTYDTTA